MRRLGRAAEAERRLARRIAVALELGGETVMSISENRSIVGDVLVCTHAGAKRGG
jgi:hypothetical protein